MSKTSYIKNHTGIEDKKIEAVLKLLTDGATIPFIARYRKEWTGGLDEVQIAKVRDASEKYDQITSRQETILKAIDEQGKLTNELKKQISECFDIDVLEDLYLPYKKKRKTRADIARDLGLEGLARQLMSQGRSNPDELAERFLSDKVEDTQDALAGARDIIAEWVNENSIIRNRLRNSYRNYSKIVSKVNKSKKELAENYRDYFDYSSDLKDCPSYRFLAMHRAANEGLLSLKIQVNTDNILDFLHRFYVKGLSPCNEQIEEAYTDAYKRLLHPTLENEVFRELKLEADIDAIKVFSKNLRQLLLSPPLGRRRVLAIDPGYRTGCKVVCLNENGDLLENATIFPHPPQHDSAKAMNKISQLVEIHKINAIAIGDGTASRETTTLVKKIRFKTDVDVFVVSEDGASIYSASEIARKEFPSYDVTVRGAVSIGRRLIDPLAELVKIDPKSIGVGQYQHEVDQKLLKESLDDIVISCVNEVGVDLNTASPYLLSYVSGLGPQLAENIIAFRKQNGDFTSREELKKVPRLGEKAFEQSAGFLRIRDGKNPLDNSAVHPESYSAIQKMSKQLGKPLEELIGNEQILKELKPQQFSYIDAYTFKDIIKELKKPGRDPRSQIQILEFDSSIRTIDDLRIGMELNGIVTNITNFGVFVNIGIKENGLIHKSNLVPGTFVENPADYIKIHEHVRVSVTEIDVVRKRIGLRKLKQKPI